MAIIVAAFRRIVGRQSEEGIVGVSALYSAVACGKCDRAIVVMYDDWLELTIVHLSMANCSAMCTWPNCPSEMHENSSRLGWPLIGNEQSTKSMQNMHEICTVNMAVGHTGAELLFEQTGKKNRNLSQIPMSSWLLLCRMLWQTMN